MDVPENSLASLKEKSEQILTAINSIKALLPNVKPLNATEVRRLTKRGSGNTDFLAETREAVIQFPEAFPAAFNSQEFTTNAEVLLHIDTMVMQMNSVAEMLRTNVAIGGSDTMKAAYHAYRYLNAASKHHPGLKAVVARLAERFKRQGNRTKKKSTEAEKIN